MMSTHTEYELNWCLLHQVIMVITRFSLFDLCWPQMTSTKNNRDRLLTMMNAHTKYKLQWLQGFHCLTSDDLDQKHYGQSTTQVWEWQDLALLAWDTHACTHTHTLAGLHRFLLHSARNEKACLQLLMVCNFWSKSCTEFLDFIVVGYNSGKTG